MPTVPLTLERVRGAEAVLRDVEGRRWVVPAELAEGSISVSVHHDELPVQLPGDAAQDARKFLTDALTA